MKEKLICPYCKEKLSDNIVLEDFQDNYNSIDEEIDYKCNLCNRLFKVQLVSTIKTKKYCEPDNHDLLLTQKGRKITAVCDICGYEEVFFIPKED